MKRIKSGLRKKRILVYSLALILSLPIQAAEQFISYSPIKGAIHLQDLTIGVDSREHSCVQLAVKNLTIDLERVINRRDVERGIFAPSIHEEAHTIAE